MPETYIILLADVTLRDSTRAIKVIKWLNKIVKPKFAVIKTKTIIAGIKILIESWMLEKIFKEIKKKRRKRRNRKWVIWV